MTCSSVKQPGAAGIVPIACRLEYRAEGMELQSLVASVVRAGREAWPAVGYTEAQLAAWLAAGGVGEAQVRAHGRDLFLAAACAEGDPGAVAALETELIARVPEYVARFHLSPDALDDLRQRVRVRLLTGDRPRIGDYRGHGPLGAWLRMCAIRTALNMRELMAAERAHGDSWHMLSGLDPSLDQLLDRQRHRSTLKEALEAALASLEPREKTLLRMHFIEGLSIDGIGLVFRVHRATAARWLVALRGKVLELFQDRLAVDLGARKSEVQSLVRLLRTEIEASVSRVLGPGAR
jgi:RNA polymerase sigma-70 factor (ECF subfamily)